MPHFFPPVNPTRHKEYYLQDGLGTFLVRILPADAAPIQLTSLMLPRWRISSSEFIDVRPTSAYMGAVCSLTTRFIQSPLPTGVRVLQGPLLP